MLSRFLLQKNVHTMFSTTRLSSVVCPVGGGLGRWDGDRLCIRNMWVSHLERIGHSQLE